MKPEKETSLKEEIRMSALLKPALLEMAQRMSDANTTVSMGVDFCAKFSYTPEMLGEIEEYGEGHLLSVAAMMLRSFSSEIEEGLSVTDPGLDEMIEIMLGPTELRLISVGMFSKAGFRDVQENIILSNCRPAYEYNRISEERERQLREEFQAQSATYKQDRSRVLGKDDSASVLGKRPDQSDAPEDDLTEKS